MGIYDSPSPEPEELQRLNELEIIVSRLESKIDKLYKIIKKNNETR